MPARFLVYHKVQSRNFFFKTQETRHKKLGSGRVDWNFEVKIP
jgi:hypothetical protein